MSPGVLASGFTALSNGRAWRSVRLLLLAVGLVLAAACGTDSAASPDAAPPTQPEATTTSSTSTSSSTTTTTEAASPERGETVERTSTVAVTGELRVSFLDVGQGDAALLQAPDATMLIDTGRHDRSEVVGLLRERGVAKIDVVAITHAHADHIGQLDRVLGSFPVTEVWTSGTPHTTRTFERALAAIERSDVAYEEPRAGDDTTVGSLAVEVLHPAGLTGDLHDDSLALRVTFGDVSFLFTGDAERETEAEMLRRDPGRVAADIYQVGHHGSSTSTTPAFLSAVSPAVAVYSAGAGNSYGHPHREVVDRLTGAGVDLYGTDTHGTVTVTADGTSWSVSTTTAAPPNDVAQPDTGRAPPPPPAASTSGDGCAAGQVDINSAASPELEGIIHIGPERAQQIIDLRPFASVDDLTRVSGIAEARLRDIEQEGVACVG